MRSRVPAAMPTEAPEESAPIENIAATLVANHRDFLAFVEKRVSNRATAEEILQDAFVRSMDKFDTVRETAVGWFYRVLRNAIIDHYRTRKETVEVPETLATDHEPETGEMEDLKASFRRMIYSLPEPYREALVLTEFEGLPQQQLAERLGISLSGAKSRVQRGRDQLKAMLHECCTFEFDRRGKVIDCTPRAKAKCKECP